MNWAQLPITVLKFSSSSAAGPDRIRHAAGIVSAVRSKGRRVAVVVSAMGNTSGDLLALARGVGEQEYSREMDQLLSTEAQQSVALVALALRQLGIPAQSFTAMQAGIRAKGFPMEGRICGVEASAVEKALNEGTVAVVTGFQGVTEGGEVITLGPGGSDLSAVALAAALGAESCRLVKNAPGVMTADPRIVKNPRVLAQLRFDECLEMAVQGAGVVQARSVEMAARLGVPLYISSGFDEKEGTSVVSNPVSEGLIVKAVLEDTDAAKVVLLGVPDIPGVAARLFSDLAEQGVGPEMIIQNNMRGGVNDIGFLVRKTCLEAASRVCRELCHEIDAQGVSFDTEIARVSVVGAGIANHPEIPSKMFNILAKAGINIEMISSSALSITCVVGSSRADDAVRALHSHFIGDAQE